MKNHWSLFLIVALMRAGWCQQWDPNKNGDENTYMQYTSHWKKEIIELAQDCISEITASVFQSEQIQWLAADDLRHAIGMTMGRIFELHRQQVDMYRRMKRIVEGQFTWLRPELAGVFHQLGPQSGVAEPAAGFEQFKPNQYDQKWVSNVKQTYQDYKPHIYITALEYITKKQTQIENLVKLLTTYTAEEEVDRFKPYNLPMGQDHLAVWKGYQTKKNLRHGPEDTTQNEEDRKYDEEEELKAQMRDAYFKKNRNNK